MPFYSRTPPFGTKNDWIGGVHGNVFWYDASNHSYFTESPGAWNYITEIEFQPGPGPWAQVNGVWTYTYPHGQDLGLEFQLIMTP
ncbi:MAG: hypothetical protein M3Q97_00845 [Bacteroidota bacterium]|nr:hypothetical protein [Bacteroidota bacterium]